MSTQEQAKEQTPEQIAGAKRAQEDEAVAVKADQERFDKEWVMWKLGREAAMAGAAAPPKTQEEIDKAWREYRRCYKYSDGTQSIYGDPWMIGERMDSFAGQFQKTVNDIIAAAFPKRVAEMEQWVNPETGTPDMRQKLIPDPEWQAEIPDPTDAAKTIPNPEEQQWVFAWKYPEGAQADKETFFAMIINGFEVKPWDRLKGTGMKWGDLRNLWNDYCNWAKAIKPEPEASPTSSPPSVAVSLPV